MKTRNILETLMTCLELDGAGPLPASNASFHFAALLKSGASYAVTIVTQPTGATCTLSNATGTIAAANITNVLVSCAANSGGGGGTGGAFWIPFSAAPVTGTTGGKSGLFLIASTTIADSPAPAPSWVTTNTATLPAWRDSPQRGGLTAASARAPAPQQGSPSGLTYLGRRALHTMNRTYTAGKINAPGSVGRGHQTAPTMETG